MPLEGEEPITPEGEKSTTVPQPILEGGRIKCPLCDATFTSMKQYEKHADDIHKVGTSTSTAIY